MAEMILPGTYIEVRDEGLIAAGPISIGNVGIVGTARRGRLGNPTGTDAPVVYTPSDLGEARDIFGGYDAFDNPLEVSQPLTLVRALELAYANGAQRVFAVRVAAGGAASAVYTFATLGSPVSATAKAPGTGYNTQTAKQNGGTMEDNASLKVVESGANLLNVTFTVGRLVETWRDVPADAADFARVINGQHVGYPYSSKSSTGGGSRLFTLNATGATGNITIVDAATFSTTAAQTVQGTDGAAATEDDYKAGMDAIANEDVHIVVLAGQDTSLADSLAGHVESASTDLMKRERIGVIGGTATDLSGIKSNVPSEDGGRIIFVAPGLKVNDAATGKEVSLPGTYAAAVVAGRISSLDPHISPTNKTVNTSGLQKTYNGTELEQLILNRVLALENRNGSFRIVKGITTSENTAWAQITTRRIVDYARFGVRASCQPYIGKLNNDRVRQAMKGTINGFLAEMVDREMLISYELEVSATREQQIRGIAQVTMTIRPTFSIDYIRVVMYLQ